MFFRHQANKRYMRLPKNLADFENYVYQTVNQYKDTIRYWEIWNEADIAFWHGTDEEYIQLMQAAYRGAKRADPTCLISMTGLAYPFPQKSRTGRLVDGRLFLEKCLRLAKNEFDIINFHSYGGIKPLQRKLEEVATLQKEFGTNKPVWITETGMPTHLNGYTEEQQARYVVLGHTLSFAGGVDKVFWHCFYDWGLDPNYHEHHFGLIHYDYSPKPAFMAYCAMTQNLAGARAQEQVTAIPGVCGVLFERNERPVSVLWSEAESRDVLVKLDADSYRLTDMMGNARSHAAPSGLARLELTENPVYLEGARVVAEIEQPLSVEPGVVLKPGETRTVQLTVRNPADAAASGVCALVMPEGWQVEPSQLKISLEQGQTKAFPLKITAPGHLRRGRASLICRLQLDSVELDGLDAGSVSLPRPSPPSRPRSTSTATSRNGKHNPQCTCPPTLALPIRTPTISVAGCGSLPTSRRCTWRSTCATTTCATITATTSPPLATRWSYFSTCVRAKHWAVPNTNRACTSSSSSRPIRQLPRRRGS